jgi:hypothetical protein
MPLPSVMIISFGIVCSTTVSLKLTGVLDLDDDAAEIGAEHLFPHVGQNFHELDSNGAWHEVQLLALVELVLKLMLLSLRCRRFAFSARRFERESAMEFAYIKSPSPLHIRRYW